MDEMFDAATGSHVAVKKMPKEWICEDHLFFTRQHPDETEQPWIDLGISAFLTGMDYDYVCPLLGVFQCKDFTYMATEFAPHGDLLTWSAACREVPGLVREGMVLPLARQIVDAVRQLHNLSFVHGDISLENIVVSHQPSSSMPFIQLIDFGMSTAGRYTSTKCGKPCYQAPEVHSGEVYDGFLSDAFSVGVVLCSVLLNQRPWMSTQPGRCKAFESFRRNGFRATVAERKCFQQKLTMAQCMSEQMTCALEGLLSVDQGNRLTLGESAPFPGHRGISVLTRMPQEACLQDP